MLECGHIIVTVSYTHLDVYKRQVSNCEVYPISLICSKEALEKHIQKDIDLGIRKADVLKRSVERLSMYDDLNTIKVDITHLTIEQTVEKICDIIHA